MTRELADKLISHPLLIVYIIIIILVSLSTRAKNYSFLHTQFILRYVLIKVSYVGLSLVYQFIWHASTSLLLQLSLSMHVRHQS